MEDVGDVFDVYELINNKCTVVFKAGKNVFKMERSNYKNMFPNLKNGANIEVAPQNKKVQFDMAKKMNLPVERTNMNERPSTSTQTQELNVVSASSTDTEDDSSSCISSSEQPVDTDPYGEFIPKDIFCRFIDIHSCDYQDTAECKHDMFKIVDTPLSPFENIKLYKRIMYQNFVLDTFQEHAVLCIENLSNLIVLAHRSTGKTTIALYAIAKCLIMEKRAIYITPIKALSNLKYRDFLQDFNDVGLINTDVIINPDATCLVITTDMFRHKLYSDRNLMKNVGYVIFDDIHVMRDKVFGALMEETFVLLPENVNCIVLSCAIPNICEFVQWLTYIRDKEFHIITKIGRSTPLKHMLFSPRCGKLYPIVNEDGIFREDIYDIAMTTGKIHSAANIGKSVLDSKPEIIFSVTERMLKSRYGPIIVFFYDEAYCELNAMKFAKLDLNNSAEKKAINRIFIRATNDLHVGQRAMVLLRRALLLFKRGIGIFHDGVMPILKEMVEILFAEGLLKVVFATESHDMSYLLTAHTVIITGLQRTVENVTRYITAGEYMQMAGRASRRDKKFGIVVFLTDDEDTPSDNVFRIINGEPDPIISNFEMSYNMILNLLCVPGLSPEYMLERSFYQFQHQTPIATIYAEYLEIKKTLEKIQLPDEKTIETYYKTRKSMHDVIKELLVWVNNPSYLLPYLQRGRLLKVKDNNDYGWGVIERI